MGVTSQTKRFEGNTLPIVSDLKPFHRVLFFCHLMGEITPTMLRRKESGICNYTLAKDAIRLAYGLGWLSLSRVSERGTQLYCLSDSGLAELKRLKRVFIEACRVAGV